MCPGCGCQGWWGVGLLLSHILQSDSPSRLLAAAPLTSLGGGGGGGGGREGGEGGGREGGREGEREGGREGGKDVLFYVHNQPIAFLGKSNIR